MGKLLRLLVILITSVCVASPALAQQRGTISGTVTSEGNQPLAGATVLVGGSALRGVTDQQGQYRIANVPAGSHDVTASVLGYAPRTQRVTVAADGTANASFQLSASALEIGGLVVTATGAEQRRREIGSSVGSISTSNVDMAPITNVTQLIQGRVPGAVVMQSSGTTGSGSRVRIRGNNSLTLSNAPLLIIDGVRVQSSEDNLGFGVGGQSVSRLNDLNPEDIENIDILKGPAASALYGTAAANGVIQVTTKRGRAGRPQFRFWTESGREEKNVTFPDNVQALDAAGDPCPIFYQAEGFCTPAQTYSFNPLEAEGTFRNGNRRTLGGSASGGSTDATFYVSGEYEDAEGIQFNNNYKRVNIQTNLTGNLGEKLRIGANVGLIESDLEMPLADNASFGLFAMGLYGSPSPSNVELQGGFESDPMFAYDWKTFQDVSRFTGSTNANYRPLSWLNINGTVGLDRTDRDEQFRIPRDNVYGVFGAPYTFGMIDQFKTTFYNLTTNGSATAQFDLSSDLASTTSIGTQYLRETSQSVEAFGATLTPGVEKSLAGASTDFDVAEGNVLNATVSAYVQQQLAWRDRLFLNASARGDQNSAFGVNLGWVWYPAFSGAWVLSDEPFFPDLAALNTLRLRAAWGQSGLRPGSTDAQLAYTSIVSIFGNTSVPGFAIQELGNTDLKPERVTEFELGFDSEFFDNRLGVELTRFDKKSTDALVRQPLAPSSGAGSAANGTAGTRFVNLGEVQNTGWELLLRGQPIRTNDIGLSFTVSGSAVKNRLNT
ncbi:MAG TPA: SusC/RagA family TonB-linked outer membrane protein, partial [Longimicrobiaceae bacterium]|nr:SusC/RagA family TonB-linked outer membrane protein [Longimicrobiaceae bacterium]